MAPKSCLSYECRNRLHQWVRAYCPCVVEDAKQEFHRGLLFILEEEVERAVDVERDRFRKSLMEPCRQ